MLFVVQSQNLQEVMAIASVNSMNQYPFVPLQTDLCVSEHGAEFGADILLQHLTLSSKSCVLSF